MKPTNTAEKRVARWLLEEAFEDVPDRVLQATFDQTRVMRQQRPVLGRSLVLARRSALLLAAALLIAGTVLGMSIAGGWPIRLAVSPPSPDALQRVLDAGVLRVAVRPDHPQRVLPNDTIDGFDVDVGREIARRLGLRVSLVALPPAEMLPGDLWDIGLPSTPDWLNDPEGSVASSAYYYWPHLLLVSATSPANSLTDVQGQPICAVAGDAGQRWLLGSYGAPTSSPTSAVPVPSSLMLRSSDAECIAALTAGDVHAAVTASMSPSDVAARGDLRVIGGPSPEARAIILDRKGPDPTAFLASVDRIIDDMSNDGTLARFSSDRFGTDLSAADAVIR